MTQYVFIESKDPLEDRGAEFYLETAIALSRQQQPVTVFFVENGAHAARKGSQIAGREALQAAGATLMVDEFALRERGITDDLLAAGIGAGSVDDLVELLVRPETKAVWH